MTDSCSTSTRRRALKLAGVTGLSGVAGITGLSLSSQPALALAAPVSLPTGLVSGGVNVSSYEIQYAELDTDSDITITYILRTSSNTVKETHNVSITDSTGAVMTSSHSISVPSGEVTLQVQLEHPSVGTITTEESSPVTVASAVPDSNDLQAHYDWSLASGTSSVADQTDNGYDLTGTYSGPTSTINGKQAGLFDGNDDLLQTSWPTQGQPNHYFAAFRVENDTHNFQWMFDSYSKSDQLFGLNDFGGYRMYANKRIDGGSHDTNTHIVSALFDGYDSVMRIDGNRVAADTTGTRSMDGLTVGAAGDGSRPTHMSVGEWIGYPQDKTAIQTDVEKYLADRWGVTL